MFKKILKAGFWGAILGAIAGLFLAPKSGKENREDLKRKVGEMKDKAMAATETVEHKAEETVHEIKSEWNQDKNKQK